MKNRDELMRLRRILGKNPRIYNFGVDRCFVRDFLSGLAQIPSSELLGCVVQGPDMMTKIGLKEYIVEHFTYDSSSKVKKGSRTKKNIESRHKEDLKFFESECLLNRIDNDLYVHTIKTDSSVQNLINTFSINFDEHEKKFLAYKQNTKNDHLWLIAENTDIVPITMYTRLDGYNRRAQVLPIFYEEVETKLLNSEIDGIMFVSNYPISNCVVCIKNSPESFRTLRAYFQFKVHETKIYVEKEFKIGFSFVST